MAIDWSKLALPKPEPRVITKARKQKIEAKAERAAREIVRSRDRGRCRVPNCREAAAHLHHIVYRSHSKARKFDPKNLVSLCVTHHQMEHAGIISIEGNADREIVIRGDLDALKFRI